ncbi:hypothetical protein FIV34_10170 [Luteibacter pinisoli]|uniref:Glycosyl hydrolase family 43 n=1 Tax=Luteibacter pinisoli TaxID=2589080 RepID=A0A4Y5Z2R1_9GAMM|nr:family 43 glycosylhydrolase [Luteibacter pinisoli]QDE39541.1 hypothetical protein FIV34_10170 [Luteibacter pinisoli]
MLHRFLAVLACLMLSGPLVAATVINGAPGTFRLDDRGNAIDAHDGDLQYFNGRYYLYGTQYGCGYQWNHKGAPFCGFRVYSSPDLATWHDEGALFDASTAVWQKRCDGSTYGCYRPHVVFNARTHRYVLWTNSYDVGVGYHVFTSATPTGPFAEVALPTLAINTGLPPGLNHGDQDVFVDEDGVAYLAYTDWQKKGDIVVERLDADYTSGTGSYVRMGLKATEAPSMFRRGATYYLTYSDPNCGYCATGTSYLHATSPLGPWQGRKGATDPLHRGLPISKDSCGGQPADVAALPGDGGTMYLYQSDRWDRGAINEGLATQFQEPLRFDASGAILPLACAATFPNPGAAAASAVAVNVPVVPGKPVTLIVVRGEGEAAVRLPLYRHGDGAGTLRVSVHAMQADGKPGDLLGSHEFTTAQLSWSPRGESIRLAKDVPAGTRLAVTLEAEGGDAAFGALKPAP